MPGIEGAAQRSGSKVPRDAPAGPRRHGSRSAVLLVALLLLDASWMANVSTASHANDAFADLCVQVRNNITGNPIPSAVVVAQPTGSILTRTAENRTDASGLALFRDSLNSTYLVEVSDPLGWFLPNATTLRVQDGSGCGGRGIDLRINLTPSLIPFPYSVGPLSIRGQTVPEQTVPASLPVSPPPPVCADPSRAPCVSATWDPSLMNARACAGPTPAASSLPGAVLTLAGDRSNATEACANATTSLVGYLRGRIVDGSLVDASSQPVAVGSVYVALRASEMAEGVKSQVVGSLPSGGAADPRGNANATLGQAGVFNPENTDLERFREAYEQLDPAFPGAARDDRFLYRNITGSDGNFTIACHPVSDQDLNSTQKPSTQKTRFLVSIGDNKAPARNGTTLLPKAYESTMIVLEGANACRAGKVTDLGNVTLTRRTVFYADEVVELRPRGGITIAVPVPDADVEIQHNGKSGLRVVLPTSTTKTGTDGRFSVRIPWSDPDREGDFTITINHPDYELRRDTLDITQANLSLLTPPAFGINAGAGNRSSLIQGSLLSAASAGDAVVLSVPAVTRRTAEQDGPNTAHNFTLGLVQSGCALGVFPFTLLCPTLDSTFGTVRTEGASRAAFVNLTAVQPAREQVVMAVLLLGATCPTITDAALRDRCDKAMEEGLWVAAPELSQSLATSASTLLLLSAVSSDPVPSAGLGMASSAQRLEAGLMAACALGLAAACESVPAGEALSLELSGAFMQTQGGGFGLATDAASLTLQVTDNVTAARNRIAASLVCPGSPANALPPVPSSVNQSVPVPEVPNVVTVPVPVPAPPEWVNRSLYHNVSSAPPAVGAWGPPFCGGGLADAARLLANVTFDDLQRQLEVIPPMSNITIVRNATLYAATRLREAGLYPNLDWAVNSTPRLSPAGTDFINSSEWAQFIQSARDLDNLTRGGDAAMPVLGRILAPGNAAVGSVTGQQVLTGLGVLSFRHNLTPLLSRSTVRALNGTPLEGIIVCVTPSSGGSPQCVVTNATGTNLTGFTRGVYDVTVVDPTGTYKSHFCDDITLYGRMPASIDEQSLDFKCFVLLLQGHGAVVVQAVDGTLGALAANAGVPGATVGIAGLTKTTPAAGTQVAAFRPLSNGTVAFEVPIGSRTLTLSHSSYATPSPLPVTVGDDLNWTILTGTSARLLQRTSAPLVLRAVDDASGASVTGAAVFIQKRNSADPLAGCAETPPGDYNCLSRAWMGDPFGLGWPFPSYNVSFNRTASGIIYPNATYVRSWSPADVASAPPTVTFAVNATNTLRLSLLLRDAHNASGLPAITVTARDLQRTARGYDWACTAYTCSNATNASGVVNLSMPLDWSKKASEAWDVLAQVPGYDPKVVLGPADDRPPVSPTTQTVGLTRIPVNFTLEVRDAHSGFPVFGAPVTVLVDGSAAGCDPLGTKNYTCVVESRGTRTVNVKVPWGNLSLSTPARNYTARYLAAVAPELFEAPLPGGSDLRQQVNNTAGAAVFTVWEDAPFAATQTAKSVAKVNANTTEAGTTTLNYARDTEAFAGRAQTPAGTPVVNATIVARPLIYPVARTALQFCSPTANPSAPCNGTFVANATDGRFNTTLPGGTFRLLPMREADVNETLASAASGSLAESQYYDTRKNAQTGPPLDLGYGATENASRVLFVDQIWNITARKSNHHNYTALVTSGLPTGQSAGLVPVGVWPQANATLSLVPFPATVKVKVNVTDHLGQPLQGAYVCFSSPQEALGQAESLGDPLARVRTIGSALLLDFLTSVNDVLPPQLQFKSNCGRTPANGTREVETTPTSPTTALDSVVTQNTALILATHENYLFPTVRNVTVASQDQEVRVRMTNNPAEAVSSECQPEAAEAKVCPATKSTKRPFLMTADWVSAAGAVLGPAVGNWSIQTPRINKTVASLGTSSVNLEAQGATEADGTWAVVFNFNATQRPASATKVRFTLTLTGGSCTAEMPPSIPVAQGVPNVLAAFWAFNAHESCAKIFENLSTDLDAPRKVRYYYG